MPTKTALSIQRIRFILISVTFALSASATNVRASSTTARRSLASIVSETPENMVAREKLAKKHFSKKEYSKTIQILSPYSNEISNDGLIMLAEAYRNSNDSLSEIRILQYLVEKDPDHFRPRFLYGGALKRANKLDDAAIQLRKAISYAPKHRPSYDDLLAVFMRSNQNYESRTLLLDMIRQFGSKKEFENLMCKLLADDGYLEEALKTCKNAVSKDPKHPDNHIYLAQTYYNQDNKAAAEKIFKTAGRQFQKSEFVQYAAGAFYLSEKNFPASVRYLLTAVKANPKSFRAQITLAKSLFESKKFDDALTHFQEACKLDDSNETLTEMKTSAAKLRLADRPKEASQYDRKSSVCMK